MIDRMLCYRHGRHPCFSCTKRKLQKTAKYLGRVLEGGAGDEKGFSRGLRVVVPDRIPFASEPYPDRLWSHLVGHPSFGRDVSMSS